MSTSNLTPAIRRLLFYLFFISGFCGLLYQVVWTRMAFASFGIITPVLSVVISVFMLGLTVGAWLGGKLIAGLVKKTGRSAVVFYALAELIIGVGAFAVPRLFAWGEDILLALGQADSVTYLFFSALVLACSILPWCIFMGTTFPLMMAFVREQDTGNAESFSFLYLANVIGAMCGTIITAMVLIECLGFRHTLWVAAAGNFSIAAICAWIGRGKRNPADVAAAAPAGDQPQAAVQGQPAQAKMIGWLLFSTGFCSMGMEVVWTRDFAPVLKTQVYSFAMVLFAYLGATVFGSTIYRDDLKKRMVRSTAVLMSLLPAAAFLPIVANDPRYTHGNYGSMSIPPVGALIVLASICPLCAVLGYLTPRLIDEYGAGNPAGAGRAYAINVLGCILGPLFASYILLPLVSERNGLFILGLPFLVFYFLSLKSIPVPLRMVTGGLAAAIMATGHFYTLTNEGMFIAGAGKNTEVRRDYAAAVLSGGTGRGKQLLVNGIGMTSLTPITKFMVHLPLACQTNRPQNALLICFGMGTGYRSALSWGIDTTAVELVPSVRDAFPFYHADAAQVLQLPNGRVIADDGRRFLKRTREKFDVIVIDPPPPVEAAGSSLLYSEEFYALARQHLKPHGILQAWFPAGNVFTAQAFVRSLNSSFPYVRCFTSVEGWGAHMLASAEPIDVATGAVLLSRMPATAKADLLEWCPIEDLARYLQAVLMQEVDIKKVLNPNPEIRVTDDHPYNEYFILREANVIPP